VPPVREEYERIPEPLQDVAVEAPLPFGKRLANQTWLRKTLIAASADRDLGSGCAR
jgi:NitT/TauT family transport system permease protein